MVEKTEVVKDPNGMWRLRLQVIDLTGEDSHLLEFPQGEERIGDTYKFFYKENQNLPYITADRACEKEKNHK